MKAIVTETEIDTEKETDVEEYVIDEEKFTKNGPLRQDNELFDDSLNIAHKVISVKRIEFGNAEDWEVLENKKTVLIIKGVRFTLKEKIFLRTVNGMQFLMSGYKSGWKSVSEFKKHLKNI